MAKVEFNSRVAIEELVLNNKRVSPGSEVDLTSVQLERLAKAGCVHLDEKKDQEARALFAEAAEKKEAAKPKAEEKPAADDGKGGEGKGDDKKDGKDKDGKGGKS